ncbi:MAG: TlpA disulfide reductase family protein [Bryobacteraceae bacterium]
MVRKSFALLFALALVLFSQVPAGPEQVGRRSPELALALGGGRQVLLSQFSGKVVALAFIHTTCPHCQAAMKVLARIQTEFRAQGFQALALAFNDNAALLIPEFVRENGINFPVGAGVVQNLYAYMDSPPRPIMLPQLFFIDRKGIIRAYHAGNDSFFLPGNVEANMRAEIEKLLQQSGGAAHSQAIHKTAQ